MLPSSEEKKLLIESMKKLTHHISNNNKRQQQIFKTLSKSDIFKILSNLTDQNQYLRRISALLLTELFYNNQNIKEQFMEMLKIAPQNGRICLSHIPESIQKYPATMKKCLELIKSPLKQGQEGKFCWTINIDKRVLHLENMEYKRYSSFTFLDPSRNIYGFYYVNNNQSTKNTKTPSEPLNESSTLLQIGANHKLSYQMTSRTDKDSIGGGYARHKVGEEQNKKRSIETSVRSIDSNRSGAYNRQQRKHPTTTNNSSFYRNYIQSRGRGRRGTDYEKSPSSSSSYRQRYEKREFQLNNSNNHNNPSNSNSKFQHSRPSSSRNNSGALKYNNSNSKNNESNRSSFSNMNSGAMANSQSIQAPSIEPTNKNNKADLLQLNSLSNSKNDPNRFQPKSSSNDQKQYSELNQLENQLANSSSISNGQNSHPRKHVSFYEHGSLTARNLKKGHYEGSNQFDFKGGHLDADDLLKINRDEKLESNSKNNIHLNINGTPKKEHELRYIGHNNQTRPSPKTDRAVTNNSTSYSRYNPKGNGRTRYYDKVDQEESISVLKSNNNPSDVFSNRIQTTGTTVNSTKNYFAQQQDKFYKRVKEVLKR